MSTQSMVAEERGGAHEQHSVNTYSCSISLTYTVFKISLLKNTTVLSVIITTAGNDLAYQHVFIKILNHCSA